VIPPRKSRITFAQWGLDFIGMINLVSSMGHKWILTATDYFTRWSEAVPLEEATEKVILDFLEGITTHFGPPRTIILDNAKAFLGAKIADFALRYGIYLKTSSNYYPQGNGLVESTNKNLIRLIKRIGVDHHKEWHKVLNIALWADRITPKQVTKISPYELVYGKPIVMPLSLEIPALQLLK